MYLDVLRSDQLYTWSDESTEAATGHFAENDAGLFCGNCPRSNPSCVAPSSSATNDAANQDANAPTELVMAPSTICR
jgi:hypothetical protein